MAESASLRDVLDAHWPFTIQGADDWREARPVVKAQRLILRLHCGVECFQQRTEECPKGGIWHCHMARVYVNAYISSTIEYHHAECFVACHPCLGVRAARTSVDQR